MLGVAHLAESSGVNLGESKETLGDGNDVFHLFNGVDSVLDSLSVFGASTIEDALNLGNLSLSPVTVGLPDRLECDLRVSAIARFLKLDTCLCDEADK